jgi:hypothetical protein
MKLVKKVSDGDADDWTKVKDGEDVKLYYKKEEG